MADTKQFARLYARLLSAARAKQTIHYSEVAPLVGLDMNNPPDRDYLGHLLGEISTVEAEEGRPMLSSVVLHKGENTIGSGFQKLGEQLRRRLATDDDDAFLVRELQATFITWAPD